LSFLRQKHTAYTGKEGIASAFFPFSSKAVQSYAIPDIAELTGRFSAITGAWQLVIEEVLPVERLVPEARSAEEPNGRQGNGAWGSARFRESKGVSRALKESQQEFDRYLGQSAGALSLNKGNLTRT